MARLSVGLGPVRVSGRIGGGRSRTIRFSPIGWLVYGWMIALMHWSIYLCGGFLVMRVPRYGTARRRRR